MYNYNTDVETIGAGVGAFAAGMVIFVIIIALIALAVAVLAIIAKWKMYVKAGQPGWKAIVPFYNTWTECQIVGITSWWVVAILLLSVLSMIPYIGFIFSLAEFAASIYFAIVLHVSMARAYGHPDGFAAGYIFLSVIFFCITGFGKAKYVGSNRPMSDPIGEWMDKFLVSHNFKSGINRQEAK